MKLSARRLTVRYFDLAAPETFGVSESASIIGNSIGYGLRVAVGDLDNDGWFDLYVYNDYLEGGYMYFNNGNGKGGFSPQTVQKTGFFTPGDSKQLHFVTIREKLHIAVVNNNDKLQFFRFNI